MPRPHERRPGADACRETRPRPHASHRRHLSIIRATAANQRWRNRMTTAARRLDAERQTAPVRDARSRIDIERIRAAFPILQQKIHGKPLVYLDNAATTQKPRAVIDAIT